MESWDYWDKRGVCFTSVLKSLCDMGAMFVQWGVTCSTKVSCSQAPISLEPFLFFI